MTPAGFSLSARGPFSFAASVRFLEGFPPAVGPTTPGGSLRLAFCVEGGWEPVAVTIEDAEDAEDAEGGGAVAVRWAGDADRARLREQVARMLSLDVDGSGFASLGAADPVVGRLQHHFGAFARSGSGRPTRPGRGRCSPTGCAWARRCRSRPR